MNKKKEKNIHAFNEDIKKNGQYQYANINKYSAYIATKRQSKELIKLLSKYTGENVTILDVGCGDGTFTYEIANEINIRKIVGFDKARSAIKVARSAVKRNSLRSI